MDYKEEEKEVFRKDEEKQISEKREEEEKKKNTESENTSKNRSSSDSSDKSESSKNLSEKKLTEKKPRERSNSSKSNRERVNRQFKTVYIKNLPENPTEKMLETNFKKFGEITGLTLMKDRFTQESLGYCFITYENSEQAKNCIEEMNNFKLEGKILRVELSNRSGPRKSTPGKYLGAARKNFQNNDNRRYQPRRRYDNYNSRNESGRYNYRGDRERRFKDDVGERRNYNNRDYNNRDYNNRDYNRDYNRNNRMREDFGGRRDNYNRYNNNRDNRDFSRDNRDFRGGDRGGDRRRDEDRGGDRRRNNYGRRRSMDFSKSD